MIKIKTNIKFFLCFLLSHVLLVICTANAQSIYDSTVDTEIVVPPSYQDSIYDEEDDYYEEEEDSIDFSTVAVLPDTARQRVLAAGYIDSLEKDAAFGYVKTGIPRPGEPKQKQAKAFRFNTIILYIAIAVFVAFLIWYLINNNVILFRRKPASLKEEEKEDDIPEDIFSIQYKQAIQKALQNKNYRLAIRLQYLQLLKVMADKKIINYRPDRTNFDYLLQLRATDYYKDFFSVTRNYEYSWYGLFDISEQQYQKMEQGFDDFYKRVK